MASHFLRLRFAFFLLLCAGPEHAYAAAAGAHTPESDRMLQIIQNAIAPEPKTEIARTDKKALPPDEPKPVIKSGVDRTTPQFLPLLASASDADYSAPSLLPLLSSQKLAADHAKITRAVILIHGSDRKAETGLARLRALAGAAAGGTAAQTIILTPIFPAETDLPGFADTIQDAAAAQHIATWSPAAWPAGGKSDAASGQKPISSMTAIDVILLYLADQESFPNLKHIVLAGYGSGGDLVQRYALFGRALNILTEQKLEPRFVVAAAQSYVYMTDVRPQAGAESFAVPKDAGAACPEYNGYPYGLLKPNDYTRQVAGNVARQHYAERNVAYLAGTDDMTVEDDLCGAKLQGKNVKERAHYYYRHVQSLFGADAGSHRLTLVPGIGNDAAKLWGSNCGVSLLFADGECVTASENPE